jgi:hypothetical protein
MDKSFISCFSTLGFKCVFEMVVTMTISRQIVLCLLRPGLSCKLLIGLMLLMAFHLYPSVPVTSSLQLILMALYLTKWPLGILECVTKTFQVFFMMEIGNWYFLRMCVCSCVCEFVPWTTILIREAQSTIVHVIASYLFMLTFSLVGLMRSFGISKIASRHYICQLVMKCSDSGVLWMFWLIAEYGAMVDYTTYYATILSFVNLEAYFVECYTSCLL